MSKKNFFKIIYFKLSKWKNKLKSIGLRIKSYLLGTSGMANKWYATGTANIFNDTGKNYMCSKIFLNFQITHIEKIEFLIAHNIKLFV